MVGNMLVSQVHLFTPSPAFDYGQMPPGSEPRAQRPWKGEGGPSGAEIVYRLAAPVAGQVRVAIVDAAGDTIARLNGTNNAGMNRVSWNLQAINPQTLAEGEGGGAGGGRGGRGGRAGGGGGGGNPAFGGRGGQQQPVNVAGFPPGFNPRPAETNTPPDTSGSPTAQARELASGRGGGRGGRGGGGGGGGGFGRGNAEPVQTGDYRVVLDAGGQKQIAVLRVVRVEPGDVAVMAPR